jgi:hypothetical protein
VDQNLNNNHSDFLWSLLENPANDASSHVYNLHRLVDDFPQSGILQALLAHASEEKNLKRASAYFNPRALFKLINAPSSFTGVPNERIVIQSGISMNGAYRHDQQEIYTETQNAFTGEELVPDKSAPETGRVEDTVSFHLPDELVVDPNASEYLGHLNTAEEHPAQAIAHEATFSEIEEHAETEIVNEERINESEPHFSEHLTEEVSGETDIHAHSTDIPAEVIHPVAEVQSEIPIADIRHEEPAEHFDPPVHEAHEEVTEHLMEEFKEVELAEQNFEFDTEQQEPASAISTAEEHPVETVAEIPVHENIKPAEPEIQVHEEIKPQPEISLSNDTDEIYDEIVGIEDINLDRQGGGQFFSFDQEFGAHEDVEEKAPGAEDAPAQGDVEQQDVSRYHDEKMPYTFMWWLDKTRKEHTKTYQPYVKAPAIADKKPKKITDELQQQYFENIFHITSVEELEKSTPPPSAPQVKRKEQVIIERFIKEEPQIKPQSSDKLDNENKAKKSSEDRDELVSETLAAIYSEQMLYHKAIASYKKLMLKFPEKSRYFAEKIEQLEKKTN